jgi:hypothetical protein
MTVLKKLSMLLTLFFTFKKVWFNVLKAQGNDLVIRNKGEDEIMHMRGYQLGMLIWELQDFLALFPIVNITEEFVCLTL